MRVEWKFRANGHSRKRRLPKKYHEEGRRFDQLRHHARDDELILSWNDIISDDSFSKHLSLESKLLWKTHGGNRGNAKSFWISKTATPKCALELFAQKIASFHCSRAGGKASNEYH
jgi:hypothetical protein